MFQFHKVRLKAMQCNTYSTANEFQFHKVRLKDQFQTSQ